MKRESVIISDKWVKASIIGVIWAAAEIVLGSFLHNLRVPFSGNLLTAIALVILIAISYRWRENGLYWRAGVICAIMKTMSPSAIIFGPMLAIVAESFLLEASVRLLGRTYAGFTLGSMLAMSWNLVQKIVNMIIFYGANLVEIYSSLTSYAAGQLNLQFNAFWAPLLLLLSLYALFGAVTAVAGIRVGRRLASLPPVEVLPSATGKSSSRPGRRDVTFRYSAGWLVADIIMIAAMLAVVSLLPWVWWLAVVIPLITILALRYKRAMRQLMKPGFWMAFVIITMLSALTFSWLRPGGLALDEAILIGVQMNFRAVIIIVGFSVLGTELYNPRIRSIFSRTRFRQLPLALELATASLPAMIADMPDMKSAVKNPVSILNTLVTRVESRLHRAREEQQLSGAGVYIVTGTIGEGKTAWLDRLATLLKQRGMTVGGILALRNVEGDSTTGYDISDISTGIRTPFLRHTGTATVGVERFTADTAGYTAGMKALDPAVNRNNIAVIIDEVGPLELKGRGWSSRLGELLAGMKSEPTLILAVRKNLLDEVITHYSLHGATVLDVAEADPAALADELVRLKSKDQSDEEDN